MKILLFLILFVFLVSCDNNFTAKFQAIEIKDILESPEDFYDKKIIVQGYASETTKTPVFSMYKLTDNSGSIWVKSESIPKENNKLYVKVRIDNIMSFRSTSFGLHLIEIERL